MSRYEEFRKAFNLFLPEKPLMGEDLRYYVLREPEVIEMLKREIKASDTPRKILFTGLPGCGKSTELARVLNELELESEWFTVYFSITDMMETTDVSIEYLLFEMCIKLYEKAQGQSLDINRGVLEDIKDWFREVTQVKFKEEGVEGEAGLLLKYLLTIGAKIKTESMTRTEIRERATHRMTDLIERVNTLITEITSRTGKQVLIGIDDLDKPDTKIIENIFYGHTSTLTSPECKIIYTVPLGLTYTENFKRIEHRFPGRPVTLPVTKLFKRDGKPDDKGVERLKEVIKARMPLELFEPEALKKIIEISGGVPKELIKNVQQSCLLAIEEKERIDIEIANKVIADIRNQFIRQVPPTSYSKYRKIANTKWVDEEERTWALDSLNVIEYLNDDLWYDLHPVLKLLISEKEGV